MASARFAAIALFVIIVGTARLPAFHDGGHDDAPEEWNFKVGRGGEVGIGGDVQIGNRLVRKGKYLLTHRSDGLRHTFTLTSVGKKNEPSQLVAAEFDTRFTSSPETVKNSKLFSKKQRDGTYEVVRIQIIGENGDHVIAR